MISTLYRWWFVMLHFGSTVWDFYNKPFIISFQNTGFGEALDPSLALGQAVVSLINMVLPDVTVFGLIFGGGITFVLVYSIVKWFTDLLL